MATFRVARATAVDPLQRNLGLRARNIEGAQAQNDQVEGQFGDPMHAQAVSNAQQNLLTARTDVNGMRAVLQGIKEAAGRRGAKVGFAEPNEGPSAQSPASWNPAGQTQNAAMRDVQQFIAGSPMPEGVRNGAPDTQEAFRRRVLQGIKKATP